MGIFDKIFGGKEEVSEVRDLEDVMDNEGDVVNPPADFYIKRIPLRNEGDADLVLKELSEKNIIILDVSPIAKQKRRLKNLIGKLKMYTNKINGDIASLTETLVILSPKNVKIVKAKK